MSSSHLNGRWEVGFEYLGDVVTIDGVPLVGPRRTRNIVPQSGINHLAGVLRGTVAPIGDWYLGVYEGDFVPTSGTTAADLQTLAQECLAYGETARPVWDETYDGVQLITNLSSRAEYTFTADKRLMGAFIVSASVKGSASGTLLSIARFASPYDVPRGSVFRLGASINIVPAG